MVVRVNRILCLFSFCGVCSADPHNHAVKFIILKNFKLPQFHMKNRWISDFTTCSLTIVFSRPGTSLWVILQAIPPFFTEVKNFKMPSKRRLHTLYWA